MPTDPGRFVATEHCGGPWDPRLLHAGPPEALIAREMRRVAGRDDAMLSRLTYELLGPVPVGEVEIEVSIARPGSRVQLLEATMHAGGRPVIRARGWQIAHSDVGASAPTTTVPPALPAGETAPVPPFDASGYVRAMRWRHTAGGYDQRGPAATWARPRLPLLPDEPTDGWDRLLLLADSANGISLSLDIATWYSIPTETSLHLLRKPTGDWVHLDAATTIAATGPGVTRGTLSDAEGVVGFVTQSLLVARR